MLVSLLALLQTARRMRCCSPVFAGDGCEYVIRVSCYKQCNTTGNVSSSIHSGASEQFALRGAGICGTLC